jgi:UDP-N-acetylmuramyl pentapeptide phosphotransferase/UDP-N-acetylglucosamine-1-phosphate transferase
MTYFAPTTLWFLTIPSVVCFLVTLLIILTQRWHQRFSADEQEGIQKVHHVPTPRVAGISLFIGFVSLSLLMEYFSLSDRRVVSTLLVAGLPALICGLWEDLSKRVSARIRLIVTLLSGLLIGYLLDIRVTRTGVDFLNHLLQDQVFISIFITTFYIAGLSNATNLIDGFNGLMLGFTLLACLTLIYIALQVSDYTVARLCGAFMGIVIGVFVFNFPFGKIFSGDGGAYFIGFFLSSMALLLTRRNESVSPMILGSVFIYPLFETVFSIYRRFFIQQKSPTQPDNLHLHSLVYRRLHQKTHFKNPALRNASVAPFFWVLSAIPMILTAFFWYSHWIVLFIVVGFMLMYIFLFATLVSFKMAYPLRVIKKILHRKTLMHQKKCR